MTIFVLKLRYSINAGTFIKQKIKQPVLKTIFKNQKLNFMAVPTPIPKDVVTEAVTSINKAIDLIKAYTVILTTEERKKLPKAGDKTYSFLQKGEEYSESDPQFLPPFVTAAEIKTFLDNYDSLRPLVQVLNQLASDVNDTSMFNISNSYTRVLQYYRLVQQGAKNNVANGKEISKDLSIRFARNKKKTIQEGDTVIDNNENSKLSKVA